MSLACAEIENGSPSSRVASIATSAGIETKRMQLGDAVVAQLAGEPAGADESRSPAPPRTSASPSVRSHRSGDARSSAAWRPASAAA